MARTKQTARTTGVVPRKQLKGIAKNTPTPHPMMHMPPFFMRVMRDINAVKEAFDAISTWECSDKELIGGYTAKHFGVVVKAFHMKPNRPFIVSGTNAQIRDTTILVEFPDNYPFSPPRITFKDKIAHPSIDPSSYANALSSA